MSVGWPGGRCGGGGGSSGGPPAGEREGVGHTTLRRGASVFAFSERSNQAARVVDGRSHLSSAGSGGGGG